MANEYNQVQLTDEEMESLNDPDISGTTVGTEITESQDNADDTSAKEPVVEESSPEVKETTSEDKLHAIEIDGVSYDAGTISKWKDDAMNKHSWQKSNTEKAQQLSKWNKLAEKINGDDTFRSHIKDFFFDDKETLNSLGLDGEIDLPATKTEENRTPETSPQIESRLNTLEKIEGERIAEHRVDQLSAVLDGLEQKYPEYLEGEKSAEFLDFADKNAVKFADGAIPNLERAFQVWSHGQMQEQLEHYKKLEKNGNRNTGVIGTSQGGAKEVKTDLKRKSYKDFKATDPDIAKYLDD